MCLPGSKNQVRNSVAPKQQIKKANKTTESFFPLIILINEKNYKGLKVNYLLLKYLADKIIDVILAILLR